MTKGSPYKGVARYYDRLYHWKNYEDESKKLIRMINTHKKTNGNEMLEVACGTGQHTRYLMKDFSILATDISKEMLGVARSKIRKNIFRELDMTDFDLHRQFDVIICLFSSIGYARTPAGLKRTIQNFSRHLKKGGIVIFDGWYTKGSPEIREPWLNTYKDASIKIARVASTKIKNNVSTVHFKYLIAEKGGHIIYKENTHSLGLFEKQQILAVMEKAGLRAKFDPKGLDRNKGVYIGVKK